MGALSGLTGLYGVRSDLDPAGGVDDGALQELQQGIPDGAHAHTGDSSGQIWPAGFGGGYNGQGVYTDSTGVLGEGAYVPTPVGGPDGPLDNTPSTHGGQYPRPMIGNMSIYDPDGLAVVGEQMRLLHGTDQGGPLVFVGDAPGSHEEPVDITVDRYDAPNENALQKLRGAVRAIIGGVGGMGGGQHLGQADVDQGYGALNDTPEFQGGHSIRVVQHDGMAWDRTSLHGDEGTWLGKHPVGETRFNGIDSPYNVQGDTSVGMQRAGTATTLGYPTEYVQPAGPTVQPAGTGYSPDVWAW